MDFKVVWTLGSRQDLQNIATFIARDNPSAAVKLGDQIFRNVDSLKSFPELGRVVPERGQPHIREIVVGNHRIIYRVRIQEKTVEILRVWPGARGTPPDWQTQEGKSSSSR